jgi:hypothetical protein
VVVHGPTAITDAGPPVPPAPPIPPAPPGALNVLFVIFDDLRVMHGAWGFKQPHTPNTDAFAAKSLIFDRAYVGPIELPIDNSDSVLLCSIAICCVPLVSLVAYVRRTSYCKLQRDCKHFSCFILLLFLLFVLCNLFFAYLTHAASENDAHGSSSALRWFSVNRIFSLVRNLTSCPLRLHNTHATPYRVYVANITLNTCFRVCYN